MAQHQDQDHPDERTHLLPSTLSKDPLRRLQQDDTDSIIDSHLSKEEQALSTSAVGERLPYNDYTTIDWLHDLVKPTFSTTRDQCADQCSRSKTLTGTKPFTPPRVFVIKLMPSSTPRRDGLLSPSAASSLPALPSSSMSPRPP